jgi:hypothetical protein
MDFCSQDCFRASRRVSVTCDYCKIEFQRSLCFAGRYNAKNFCSRECTCKARRTNPDRIAIKRLRYGSTEFLKRRQEVLERDGVCQICGDALANSVHHLNWKPYDNDLINLILLCKSCHGRFRRFESFEDCKNRIMACSDLHGNMQRDAEMTSPVFDGNNRCAAVSQVGLEVCV